MADLRFAPLSRSVLPAIYTSAKGSETVTGLNQTRCLHVVKIRFAPSARFVSCDRCAASGG